EFLVPVRALALVPVLAQALVRVRVAALVPALLPSLAQAPLRVRGQVLLPVLPVLLVLLPSPLPPVLLLFPLYLCLLHFQHQDLLELFVPRLVDLNTKYNKKSLLE